MSLIYLCIIFFRVSYELLTYYFSVCLQAHLRVQKLPLWGITVFYFYFYNLVVGQRQTETIIECYDYFTKIIRTHSTGWYLEQIVFRDMYTHTRHSHGFIDFAPHLIADASTNATGCTRTSSGVFSCSLIDCFPINYYRTYRVYTAGTISSSTMRRTLWLRARSHTQVRTWYPRYTGIHYVLHYVHRTPTCIATRWYTGAW